jgi:DinB superfamily
VNQAVPDFQLEPHELPARYGRYVERVPEPNVLEAMHAQATVTRAFIEGLSDAEASYRAAPEKWNAKETIGHLIDVERIFSMRALRFSRDDFKPRMDWDFDRDAFVKRARYTESALKGLLKEFDLLRRANVLAFRRIPAEGFTKHGVANGDDLSVRALLIVLLGHERHHLEGIKAALEIL